MKKRYITPNMDVVLLGTSQKLLAGSYSSPIDPGIPSGPALGRDFDDDTFFLE